jgi:hypothetical protein
MPILHLNGESIPQLHLLHTGNDRRIALLPYDSIASRYREQGTKRVQTRCHPTQPFSMEREDVLHARLQTLSSTIKMLAALIYQSQWTGTS